MSQSTQVEKSCHNNNLGDPPDRGCTLGCTEFPDSALSDRRLARLTERWPALPEAVREAIAALSGIETGGAT